MKTKRNVSSGRSFYLVSIFILLAFAVGLTGYYYYDYQKTRLKEEIQNQLSVVADLKVAQLVNWREERLADAEVFLSSPALVSEIRQILLNAGTAEMKRELLARFSAVQKHYGYANIFLVDAGGTVRAAMDGKAALNDAEKKYFAQALLKGKTSFSDFYRTHKGASISLDVISPVFVSAGGRTAPEGALVLRIDPSDFLYPLIQAWPTKSRTAETLLVERDGDDVVFLNELRFKKNTALIFRIPIVNDALPAAMAARGIRGTVEGEDYRGVPVLAALRAVPDTPWLMVAKVDQEEIYSPVRERAALIAAFIVAFMIAAGLGVGYWERRNNAAFYRRQLEAELGFAEERRKIAESLEASEQRYRLLLDSIAEAIYGTDMDGRCTFSNPACVSMLGYERPEDLLGKNMHFLIHHTKDDGSANPIETCGIFRAFWQGEGVHLKDETLWRADGTSFPAEVWSFPQKRNGVTTGAVVAFVDISERKQNEAELRRKQEQLEELNRTLDQKVRLEVEKNREMDRLMMVQSRHAAMGEMIGNIAHQWRQPINVVGLIMQDLHDAYRHGSLTEDYLAKSVGQGMNVIQHMSQTIDDFRNFFSSDKERRRFSVNDVIDRTLSFVEAGFRNSDIEISLEMEDGIEIEGLPNEYSQAFLNILNNAKDALLERKVADPRVRIRLCREGDRSVAAVANNAGGIPEDVIDKIFDPYFTTKEEGKGTGIGLYMSKNIIEGHMGGILTVRNIPGGAEFSIKV